MYGVELICKKGCYQKIDKNTALKNKETER
jgi:hypothetical protein